MSISRRDIASALATAFGPASVTAPSGEPALASCTHLLPDRIDQTPCALVFPPVEELAYPPSSRASQMDWVVRFYLFRTADTPRQTDRLYLWMDALYPQLDDRVHLSLSSVVEVADVVGMRAGTIEYASEAFDGIEVAVRVTAGESVTYSG